MSFLNAVTTFFRTTFTSEAKIGDAPVTGSDLPRLRRGYVYCLRGAGDQREDETCHPFACIQTLYEKDRTYVGISVCSAGKPRRKHDQFSRKTARLLAAQRVLAAKTQSPGNGPFYGSFAQDDVLRAAALGTFFTEIARPDTSKAMNWSRRAQEHRLHTLCEQLNIPYRSKPITTGGSGGATKPADTTPAPAALPDPLESIRQTNVKTEEVLRRFTAMRAQATHTPADAAVTPVASSNASLEPEDVVSIVTNPLDGTVDLTFRDGTQGTVHARTHYLVPLEMSAADFNNVRIENGALRWCSASPHWSHCSKHRMYALAHKLPAPYLDAEILKNREIMQERLRTAQAAQPVQAVQADAPTEATQFVQLDEPSRAGWSAYDFDNADNYYCG